MADKLTHLVLGNARSPRSEHIEQLLLPSSSALGLEILDDDDWHGLNSLYIFRALLLLLEVLSIVRILRIPLLLPLLPFLVSSYSPSPFHPNSYFLFCWARFVLM